MMMIMYCVYAGFVEVCIMHPLDLIKTRFQIQRGADDPTRYNSMLDCVRKMYRTEGYVVSNLVPLFFCGLNFSSFHFSHIGAPHQRFFFGGGKWGQICGPRPNLYKMTQYMTSFSLQDNR